MGSATTTVNHPIPSKRIGRETFIPARQLNLFVAYAPLRRNVTPIRTAMSAPSSITEAEIWDRAIRPDLGDLPAVAAREFLRLKLSEVDLNRVRKLSATAGAGTLSAEEMREMDHYLNVGRTLEFIKARLSLRASA